MGGQHRKDSKRSRLAPLLAALTLLAAGSGVVMAVRSATTCEPVEVVVAADPDVVEPVRQAVSSERSGAAACAKYYVFDATPDLARSIKGGAAGLPAVWIPDSSLALDLDPAVGPLVRQGPSLASSPVVMVVPTADAARYGDPAAAPTWSAMLGSQRPPALPDPASDRAGLSALVALRGLIGDESGRPRPDFVAGMLSLARTRLDSAATGYTAVDRDGGGAPAFVSSEQAAVAHNRASTVDVDVVELPGGATLDYPFVQIGGRPEVTAAVDALEGILRGPAGRAAFAAAGMRAPDGTRPAEALIANGWLGERVPPNPQPLRSAAVETLRLWSSVTLPTRLLAAIDVSSSMTTPSGGSDRITLTAQAAQAGLGLLHDASQVGLWDFAARDAPDQSWDELVPLGPLTEPVEGGPTRRDALGAQAATLRDRVGEEDEPRAALYDTVLAATRAVRAGYAAGSSNSVMLITDSRNDTDGLDLATLVQILRTEADPARPVPVIAIGLGPDADADALRQIAQATGGRSYPAVDPREIRGVFLDALVQRACRPLC